MDQSTEPQPAKSTHESLSSISIEFHQLQDALLQEPDSGHGEQLRLIAGQLIELCQARYCQVLGELFLSEHSNYNFTKPLYVAASLIELIRRCREHDDGPDIDDDKCETMVMAALGYNLGLLANEKKIYHGDHDLSLQEKKQLRAEYPGLSASILLSAGLDRPVLQDVLQNHNIASDNPSPDALVLRTPFIYAGIAMPQKLGDAETSIDNPTREFAKMYANRELDPLLGGLFLKINGLAPVGSIIKLESNEKAMVLSGPEAEDIASSTVRMLANRNGVQLKRPGEIYRLNKTPTRHCGLADHHHFAWTNFSPHVMWEE